MLFIISSPFLCTLWLAGEEPHMKTHRALFDVLRPPVTSLTSKQRGQEHRAESLSPPHQPKVLWPLPPPIHFLSLSLLITIYLSKIQFEDVSPCLNTQLASHARRKKSKLPLGKYTGLAVGFLWSLSPSTFSQQQMGTNYRAVVCHLMLFHVRMALHRVILYLECLPSPLLLPGIFVPLNSA